MANKYQEALDYLNKPLNWKNDANEIGKNIIILQELVDISSKPTIIYGDENTCVVNLEQIDKLEKALKKACVLLSKWEVDDTHDEIYWKEWLLKDE